MKLNSCDNLLADLSPCRMFTTIRAYASSKVVEFRPVLDIFSNRFRMSVSCYHLDDEDKNGAHPLCD